MRLRQRGLERYCASVVLDGRFEITPPEQYIGQVKMPDRFMLTYAQRSSICSFGAGSITQTLERKTQVHPR